METFLEIVKITIPPSIVAIIVYFIMKAHYDNEERVRRHSIKDHSKDVLLPLQFQALERLILLLERITPHNLMSRIEGADLTAQEYSIQLLYAITQEYDHNVAQQLYVSHDSWRAVNAAKDWVYNLVRQAAKGLPQGANADLLKKVVIETAMAAEILPTAQAILILKTEAK